MSHVIKPFSTTGIGSLPHTDAEDACELVLRTFDIPFWPQLPKASFRESMVPQYSEGLPYLRVNETEESVRIIRDDSDELERFYEACPDSCRIAISKDYAKGLHAFLEKIKGRRFAAIKGHVTGPVTFALGLKDHYGRSVWFDEELREIASMLLKAKMRWQLDLLKPHADKVIIFIDEPILSALGSSAYLGVDNGEVLRLLKEMSAVVEEAGGASGIHCCGRADWPLVMQSGMSVLNFDAFEYFDTLAIYHEEIRAFLQRGGYLAWGVVPTSDVINSVDEAKLTALMRENLDKLHKHLPSDLVDSRILLTPSCGTGSRSIEEATRIFQFIMRLKEALV
ncbi:MAG TPA: hypothetical protein VF790_00170 [Dissulfurispiraceae bacterium]